MIPLILISALVLTYVYYKYSFTYWHRKKVVSSETTFPFGNIKNVVLQRQSMADKINHDYMWYKLRSYKYCGLYFFSRKVFLPIDSEIIKNILCKDFEYFHDRGIYYDEENDPISAHLFSLAGPKWRNLRHKLTPAFTAGKIKYMFNAMASCSEQMVIKVKEDYLNSSLVEVKEILARFTTDVIGSCAFGVECNSIKNPDAEFRIMGKRAFTQTPLDVLKMVIIRSVPSLAKLLKLGVFPSEVSQFFKRMVEETIEYREKNNITRKDFLKLLIDMKNNGKLDHDDDGTSNGDKNGTGDLTITTNEAAAQAFIFFLAGFETTSTAMSFAILEMAYNSAVQDKARREVAEVLAKYDNKICYEAIMEMKYLDMVVYESMRKYPPAPVFLRKCTKDYHIPGTDVTIEKGLSVLIPTISLHMDPRFFENPNKFDPERFSEENRQNIKDHVYIPFGYGPRVCIGSRFAMVQAKLALSMLLRTFKFNLSKKTTMPLKMETKGIVLSPVGGIWLNLEKVE